jgi:hypothetical protein
MRNADSPLIEIIVIALFVAAIQSKTCPLSMFCREKATTNSKSGQNQRLYGIIHNKNKLRTTIEQDILRAAAEEKSTVYETKDTVQINNNG